MCCLAGSSSGVSGSVISSLQHRHQRRVLPGQVVQPRSGGVDQADAVVGEVGGLDDPGPRVAPQAVRDVLPVLLVRVAVRRVLRVRHRGDELGHPRPELPRQHRERGLPAAGRVGQLGCVIFHRVVQQGGGHHVGVVHAVVRHDPDRHPEQVVDVRLPLPAVGGVQPRRKVQGLVQATLVRLGPGLDLGREPGSQSLLAVGRGDRVQGHRRYEPPLAGVHALELAQAAAHGGTGP